MGEKYIEAALHLLNFSCTTEHQPQGRKQKELNISDLVLAECEIWCNDQWEMTLGYFGRHGNSWGTGDEIQSVFVHFTASISLVYATAD